jgi:YNFM family putative membrane transporter
MVDNPTTRRPSPNTAIALLAVAAFASQGMVRSADSLLPQIASDFATSVGTASIIVSAYAVAHGTIQFVAGPIGDRIGKYLTVAIACALSALTVLMCALAPSLDLLALARFSCGITAASIIPLGLAFVGDVVPYEARQQVLGRFASGQIMGQLFGQAAGGVIGDWFGWRSVFIVLTVVFAAAAMALAWQLLTNPTTRPDPQAAKSPGLRAAYRAILSDPWARVVLIATFFESMLLFGVFPFVGADLRLRFGLSFTGVGLVIGFFALGGLGFAASVNVLMGRLGRTRLAAGGGVVMAVAFVTLAIQPVWWLAPAAVFAVGYGFYMLHNTLQTVSTQMSPKARGTAVAVFASAFFLGQTAGVPLAAPVVDHIGAPLLFIISAVLLPILAWWFAGRLKDR